MNTTVNTHRTRWSKNWHNFCTP